MTCRWVVIAIMGVKFLNTHRCDLRCAARHQKVSTGARFRTRCECKETGKRKCLIHRSRLELSFGHRRTYQVRIFVGADGVAARRLRARIAVVGAPASGPIPRTERWVGLIASLMTNCALQLMFRIDFQSLAHIFSSLYSSSVLEPAHRHSDGPGRGTE